MGKEKKKKYDDYSIDTDDSDDDTDSSTTTTTTESSDNEMIYVKAKKGKRKRKKKAVKVNVKALKKEENEKARRRVNKRIRRQKKAIARKAAMAKEIEAERKQSDKDHDRTEEQRSDLGQGAADALKVSVDALKDIMLNIGKKIGDEKVQETNEDLQQMHPASSSSNSDPARIVVDSTTNENDVDDGSVVDQRHVVPARRVEARRQVEYDSHVEDEQRVESGSQDESGRRGRKREREADGRRVERRVRRPVTLSFNHEANVSIDDDEMDNRANDLSNVEPLEGLFPSDNASRSFNNQPSHVERPIVNPFAMDRDQIQSHNRGNYSHQWNNNNYHMNPVEHQSVQSDGRNGRRHGYYDDTGDDYDNQQSYRRDYSDDRNIVYDRSRSNHGQRDSYGQSYDVPCSRRQNAVGERENSKSDSSKKNLKDQQERNRAEKEKKKAEKEKKRADRGKERAERGREDAERERKENESERIDTEQPEQPLSDNETLTKEEIYAARHRKTKYDEMMKAWRRKGVAYEHKKYGTMLYKGDFVLSDDRTENIPAHTHFDDNQRAFAIRIRWQEELEKQRKERKRRRERRRESRTSSRVSSSTESGRRRQTSRVSSSTDSEHRRQGIPTAGVGPTAMGRSVRVEDADEQSVISGGQQSSSRLDHDGSSASDPEMDDTSVREVWQEQPEQPDVSEEQPDVPEEQPDVPEEQPDVPEEQPDVPEEQPDVPEEQPDVPEEQPDVPEEQPIVPEEQPDVPEGQPDVTGVPEVQPNDPEEDLGERQNNPGRQSMEPLQGPPMHQSSRQSDSNPDGSPDVTDILPEAAGDLMTGLVIEVSVESSVANEAGSDNNDSDVTIPGTSEVADADENLLDQLDAQSDEERISFMDSTRSMLEDEDDPDMEEIVDRGGSAATICAAAAARRSVHAMGQKLTLSPNHMPENLMDEQRTNYVKYYEDELERNERAERNNQSDFVRKEKSGKSGKGKTKKGKKSSLVVNESKSDPEEQDSSVKQRNEVDDENPRDPVMSSINSGSDNETLHVHFGRDAASNDAEQRVRDANVFNEFNINYILPGGDVADIPIDAISQPNDESTAAAMSQPGPSTQPDQSVRRTKYGRRVKTVAMTESADEDPVVEPKRRRKSRSRRAANAGQTSGTSRPYSPTDPPYSPTVGGAENAGATSAVTEAVVAEMADAEATAGAERTAADAVEANVDAIGATTDAVGATARAVGAEAEPVASTSASGPLPSNSLVSSVVQHLVQLPPKTQSEIEMEERLKRRQEEEQNVDKRSNTDMICNMICSVLMPPERTRCRKKFEEAKQLSLDKPLSTIFTKYFTNGFLQAVNLPADSSFSGPTNAAQPTDKDGQPLQSRPLDARGLRPCSCTLANLKSGVSCTAPDHTKRRDKLRKKQGLPVTIVLIESSDEDE